MSKGFTGLLGALVVALAVAGQAGAATWNVSAGVPFGKPPPSIAKQVPASSDVEQFFPQKLTIRAGDRVHFTTFQGHTATFYGNASLSQFNFVVADPKNGTYSGVNDPAGNPFYYNGMAKMIFNPGLAAPVGSTRVADKKVHSRPVFGGPPSEAALPTFSFPKAGTYRYICLLHPLMEGTIVVKGKGANVPSATAVKNSVQGQITHDIKTLQSLSAVKPTDPDTVYMGVGTKEGISLDEFVPNKLTVKKGTTVVFINNSPQQPHNVAFGDPKALKKLERTQDLFPDKPGGPNQIGPWFIYGSEAQVDGAYVLDGTEPSGILQTQITDDLLSEANDFTTLAFPQKVSIRTDKAGTYHGYCELHGPMMSIDITVTD